MLGAAAVVIFLGFWEISVAAGWVNPLFTSSPTRIAVAAVEMFADGSIWEDLQVIHADPVERGAADLHKRGIELLAQQGDDTVDPCLAPGRQPI